MNAQKPNASELKPADSVGAPQGDGASAAKAAPRISSPRLTVWQKFRLIFKVVEIRLRFIAILIIVGLFVGYWDTITNHWDKQTRSDGAVYKVVRALFGERGAHWLWPQAGAASESDSEYYCPMHPNVVRQTLDPDGSVPKCPICGMPLSLRKKGEVPKLPEGVLSRKQYSPQQIQAAGINTVEVAYRPLEKEITTVGYVTYDESRRSRIVVRVSGYLEKLYVDKPWTTVKKGEALGEIYSPELYSTTRELLLSSNRGQTSELAKSARERLRLLGIDDKEIDEIVKSGNASRRLVLRSPMTGHLTQKDVVQGAHVEAGQTLFEVADLSKVWIEADVYEADIDFIRKGQAIEATVEAFPGRVFAAKVSLVHPHMDAATRTNAVRFELDNPGHQLRPGMFATVRIKIPLSEVEPFKTLTAKPGEVLAVPEPSVIDTGTKKIVYVEREPGLFEGVEAELGARVDEFYPVIKGLTAGERVAARGAFLVDAETRLNPAASATYIGASGGPQSGTPESAAPSAQPAGSTDEHHSHAAEGMPLTESKQRSTEDLRNIAKLAEADRELALAQRICPISGEPLGSMGVPVKITLKDRPVLLCCKGCVDQAKKSPDKVLSKLAELTKSAGGKN
jgi:membrane fusion protein, copper/silver efflux system